VIVGGGSAGCVLANRLSADPAVSVLLLEAGGRNDGMLVRMPAAVSQLIKNEGQHNWGFWTDPEPHLDGRRLWWPRGKGLGGSSAINGMIYVRGHRRDYDEWRQLGLAGWSWDDVAPYFHRLERHHRAGEHHGGDGPLHVSAGESSSPFNAAFIAAGRQAGYPVNANFNGPEQAGFGPFDLTVSNGRRWSAAAAYLDPVRDRPNLTIVTGARITAIRLERGRAVGVDYVTGKRGAVSHAAAGEVLLCAGAVQSPHILQLSGIGAPDDLAAAGVRVRHALPGVGGNLQDHLDVVMNWRTRGLTTAYSATKGLRQLAVGLRYMMTGQGIGRQQFLETGAFLPSREGLDRPDIQIHAVLGVFREHGKYQPAEDGFTLHLCQLRPESRGRIALRSADPFADPAIRADYLATPEDRRVLREAVRDRPARGGAGGARAVHDGRDLAGRGGGERRGDRHLGPRDGGDDLPPGRHLRDGGGRRRERGRRRGAARPRAGRAAGGGRVGDAAAGRRQHQRADDHDRGEGGGSDSGEGGVGGIALFPSLLGRG